MPDKNQESGHSSLAIFTLTLNEGARQYIYNSVQTYVAFLNNKREQRTNVHRQT